jgi:predicted amidophosphoribosyltransferase
MICSSCSAELPDDAESCYLCGEEVQGLSIRVRGATLGQMPSPEYFARMELRHNGIKRYFEGRGLERAGDIGAALACYESLVADGFDLDYPYERLAIIYRKSRRAHDEERIVRAALAAIGDSPKQQWFSSRLDRLIVQRGLRELTE